MSASPPNRPGYPAAETPRPAKSFRIDDPTLNTDSTDPFADTAGERTAQRTRPSQADPAPGPDTSDTPRYGHRPQSSATGAVPSRPLSADDLRRGLKWGSIFFSAAVSLALLAAGVWFTRFTAVALAREDWVGWVSVGLLAIMVVAATVVVIRELLGVRRLARLNRLRAAVDHVLSNPDSDKERRVVRQLLRHYSHRSDMSLSVKQVAAHLDDVLDHGALLRLADRELFAKLDDDARRLILTSSKRVATVTALSPIMFIAMGFVLVESVRMFRALATLYGGRPGTLGALRLAKLVVGHIIATGGLALTDDLLGQFLGQDVLRRLSRRLGEGAFNGALTARLGVAAVDVIRPLPPLDGEPVRVREIFSELFRSLRGKA